MNSRNTFSQTFEGWRKSMEEVILGACLSYKQMPIRVIDLLDEVNFNGYTIAETESGARISHANVWSAIKETAKQGPVDILTVWRAMLNQFEDCDNLYDALYDLESRVASAESIETHALRLIELSIIQNSVSLIDSWLEDAEGDKKIDFEDLCSRYCKLDFDVFDQVETTLRFLREAGYEEEAEEFQRLIAMLAQRILKMKRNTFKRYIEEQYRLLHPEGNPKDA